MIQATALPITRICKDFRVSRQGFYKWKDRKPPSEEDRDILGIIQEIALVFPKYGYRRMTAELHRRGNMVNHKRVHRIMRENNLFVIKKKLRTITTQ